MPSRRLSVRSGVMPSTTTLPSRSRRKLSAPPGACVVNSPMISSTMSSIVTRPLHLAVLVDDQPQPLAVALELRELRQQRRADRDEVGRPQQRAQPLGVDLAATAAGATTS